MKPLARRNAVMTMAGYSLVTIALRLASVAMDHSVALPS